MLPYPVGGIRKISEGNRWSTPDKDCVAAKWSTRGYIASLNPFSERADAIVRMFSFTVRQLPRDQSLWGPRYGLTDCTLRIGENQESRLSLVLAS